MRGNQRKPFGQFWSCAGGFFIWRMMLYANFMMLCANFVKSCTQTYNFRVFWYPFIEGHIKLEIRNEKLEMKVSASRTDL